MGLMGENVMDSEGFSQEWFDEDFGLTRSRREAEELRRQQLQIEQEVRIFPPTSRIFLANIVS